MSLVGPRPHAAAHNEQYRKMIEGYMLRHKVKPGITGLAQVRGWRGETDTLEKMQRRVECDHEYIREWSLWLDMQDPVPHDLRRAASGRTRIERVVATSCRKRHATEGVPYRLLLLFVVQRVLAEPRAELFQLELFAAGLAAEDVVHVACLFANQKDDFGFLLALGHLAQLRQCNPSKRAAVPRGGVLRIS